MDVPATNLELKILNVPRGKRGLANLQLDMTEIYKAEGRLYEVGFANEATSGELQAYFNLACNQVTKYLSWIEFEILTTKRSLELAKAVVVLDKMPEEMNKLKALGIKGNEDFRSALIARDPECAFFQETLDQLTATKALLEGKSWSFVRGYGTAKSISERKTFTPTPTYHGARE